MGKFVCIGFEKVRNVAKIEDYGKYFELLIVLLLTYHCIYPKYLDTLTYYHTEASCWPSGYRSQLQIMRSGVWILLRADFSSWLYSASLYRAFHYHPSIISIWLQLWWNGCKTPNNHHSQLMSHPTISAFTFLTRNQIPFFRATHIYPKYWDTQIFTIFVLKFEPVYFTTSLCV